MIMQWLEFTAYTCSDGRVSRDLVMYRQIEQLRRCEIITEVEVKSLCGRARFSDINLYTKSSKFRFS